MFSKEIARLGFLAGIAMYVRQMGGGNISEDKVVFAASENLSRKTFSLLEGSEFKFAAAHNCSLALRRGFYFSLRMPDWAKDFKQQTQKILALNFELPKVNLRSSKDKKLASYYGDNREERYGSIFSESSGGRFFEHIPKEVSEPSKYRRSPKIKDDLTCGKRVTP
ncbi:uncharacterized protein LOC108093797 [Drosophila ficusphila]|uniref:uncharacterized protein LOC108093797 n=1 Tax=Drosophila ficusphila TaxID=30025 RepID=UPI0007E605FC|nr:uncharacterized protein LOC108093797 [Drosophila ficusphila]